MEPCAAVRAVSVANEGDRLVAVDVDGAIGRYREAAALAPRQHRIAFKLGMALRKKEDWEGAAAAFARAAEAGPGFASYLLEQGVALEQLARRGGGRWQAAREPLARCVAIDPGLADCHEELGHVWLHLDDEPKALESYTRAIEREPTRGSSYATLADLYLRLGKTTEAEQVLVAGERLAAPDDRARFGLHILHAQVHQQRGALAERVTELEAARAAAGDREPDAMLILYLLGSAYAWLDPPRKAEATQLLRAFAGRVCKSAKAVHFRSECETASILIRRMGGTP